MSDLLLLFVGAVWVALVYFFMVVPLQRRIGILRALHAIAVAQREAALVGKDRAFIVRLYAEGCKHYKLKDPAEGADDVLSGRNPGPVVEEW